MQRRHETPLRRVNPSGKIVWVARYTGRDGKRHVAKPDWNRGKGTFDLKRDAQRAIDEAYDGEWAPTGATTVGDYFAGWLREHPRSERTDVSYDQRVRYVLDVKLDGRPFRDWPIGGVERKHAVALLDHMLRVQGRAANGARGVLRVLSAMWEDIADDGHRIPGNPFMGVKVRSSDRRIVKASRETPIWTWEQMHEFAAACGPYEPLVRVLSDCGPRIGEATALHRADVFMVGACGDPRCRIDDGPHLHVRGSAWRRRVASGTKTDHGEPYAGRETPLAPGVAGLLEAMPKRIDTPLLFPNPDGLVWARDFYRDVWEPARKATGMRIATPQSFRHSYVSLMRAAGVDPADLAYWTGHTVMTATTHYTHATATSAGAAREAIGA